MSEFINADDLNGLERDQLIALLASLNIERSKFKQFSPPTEESKPVVETNGTTTTVETSKCRFIPTRRNQTICNDEAVSYGFCERHIKSIQAKKYIEEQKELEEKRAKEQKKEQTKREKTEKAKLEKEEIEKKTREKIEQERLEKEKVKVDDMPILDTVDLPPEVETEAKPESESKPEPEPEIVQTEVKSNKKAVPEKKINGKAETEKPQYKKPSVRVVKNRFGNYDYEGLLFDIYTKQAYGRQNSDGSVLSMSDKDIELCKKNGWPYYIEKKRPALTLKPRIPQFRPLPKPVALNRSRYIDKEDEEEDTDDNKLSDEEEVENEEDEELDEIDEDVEEEYE